MRTGIATPRSLTGTDSEENERVARMGRQLSLSDEFIQKFAKETVEWIRSVQTLMSVLRVWAEDFGRVISPGPDITSEAFDAFLFVIDVQLPALCLDLEVAVASHLLPQLRILHDTIRRPVFSIRSMPSNPIIMPCYITILTAAHRLHLIQLRLHTSRYGRGSATSFLSTLISFTGV